MVLEVREGPRRSSQMVFLCWLVGGIGVGSRPLGNQNGVKWTGWEDPDTWTTVKAWPQNTQQWDQIQKQNGAWECFRLIHCHLLCLWPWSSFFLSLNYVYCPIRLLWGLVMVHEEHGLLAKGSCSWLMNVVITIIINVIIRDKFPTPF